jgi:hypothetical protein
MSAQPQLTEVETKISIPEGYVLVERSQYEFMMEMIRNKGNQRYGEKDDQFPHYNLKVLKRVFLGDINIQLSEDQKVVFAPGEYLKIDGEKHKTYKSFLTIFKSDFRTRKGNIGTYFEILNPMECPDIHEMLTPVKEVKKEQVSEAATKEQETVEHFGRKVPANKPEGMSDAQWIIKNLDGNSIDRPKGSMTNVANSGAVKTVDQFEVTTSRQSGQFVAKVPGKPADQGAPEKK